MAPDVHCDSRLNHSRCRLPCCKTLGGNLIQPSFFDYPLLSLIFKLCNQILVRLFCHCWNIVLQPSAYRLFIRWTSDAVLTDEKSRVFLTPGWGHTAWPPFSSRARSSFGYAFNWSGHGKQTKPLSVLLPLCVPCRHRDSTNQKAIHDGSKGMRLIELRGCMVPDNFIHLIRLIGILQLHLGTVSHLARRPPFVLGV